MNLNPSDRDLRDVVARCIGAVDVPRFDLPAIQTRAAVAHVTRRSTTFRRALVAVPAALVLAALLGTMPSVVAQVQRVLRAFAVIDGQTVPLSVRTVSLDEARAQMPFEVIAPAEVPAGLRLTINELASPSAPNDARLVFEYRAHDELPVLTIEESSAASKGPSKMMMFESRTSGGPAAPAVPNAPQAGDLAMHGAPAGAAAPGQAYIMRDVRVRRVNGRSSTQRVELHPIVWTARGTRILIAAAPGGLTAGQVDAMRRSMSR